SDHVESWTDGLLDAGTDFLAQEALRGFLERGASPEATRAAWLRRRARRSEGHTRLGFSATHDQVRTLSRVGDRRLARLEQLAVLTRPEVPALLYGDEIGLASDAPERGFEDAWPDRMPMPWDRTSWDATTLALVKGGLALRRASAALRRGDELALDWGHAEVAGFRRRAGEETVDVALHRGEGEVRLPLPGGAPPQGRLLLVAGEARIEEGALWLGPKSGAALAREASREARELFEAVHEEGPRVAAEAFVEGWDECPALPSRLYLTLTERCNLRCVHCITGAPARTADGSARDMAPWVLDALREAFAGARYVGLSHGGESLVHGRFFETLATIQQARAGRPGRLDVHLLTNGRRLDPDTLASSSTTA
ncbi:MAG TPA: hypothetical protein RMH26_11260, partial [Polyangiaceae bacterium LLY-WYZ-15_(1-7)]|nr:hypothetical protein [Polyangiaceae bacterium LLY-WYZ-15_(1-7)]